MTILTGSVHVRFPRKEKRLHAVKFRFADALLCVFSSERVFAFDLYSNQDFDLCANTNAYARTLSRKKLSTL